MKHFKTICAALFMLLSLLIAQSATAQRSIALPKSLGQSEPKAVEAKAVHRVASRANAECEPINRTWFADASATYEYTTQNVRGTQAWRWYPSGNSSAPYISVSGFQSNTNYENEDWLLLPAVDLSSMKSATITFKHAINYADLSNAQSEMTLLVSTNYYLTNDVEQADWQELSIDYPTSNGWTFKDVTVDASSYCGVGNVVFAWRYISGTSNAATWEIKNVVLTTECASVNTDDPLNPSQRDDVITVQLDPNIPASIGWDEVALYAWLTDDAGVYVQDALGGWPGRQLQPDPQIGWYSYTFPEFDSDLNLHIIWNNNGNGNQTHDIDYVTQSTCYRLTEYDAYFYALYDVVDCPTANQTTYYTLTVNASAGGTVDRVSGRYEEGKSVTFKAYPDEGYEFVQWSDGVKTNPRTVTMTSNITLTAEFQEQSNDYYLTFATEGNGKLNLSSGNYAGGEELTLVATPKSGYKFAHWEDNSTQNPRTIVVSSDATYTAYFTANNGQTYTIIFATENSSDKITHRGTKTYEDGKVVELTATNNTRRWFYSWSDGNTDNPRYYTVTKDATLYAFFIDTYYLDVQGSEGGKVNSEVSGYYNETQCVDVVATADKGWEFAGWYYNNQTTPIRDAEYTINSVNENITLKASFRLITGIDRLNGVVAQVYGAERMLIAESSLPQDIAVYSIGGQLIAEQGGITHYEQTLQSGLYIVRLGEKTYKVIVK